MQSMLVFTRLVFSFVASNLREATQEKEMRGRAGRPTTTTQYPIT